MNFLAQSFSGDLQGFSAILAISLIILGIGLLTTLLLLPFMFILGKAKKQAEKYKLQRLNVVVAQYEPPLGLSPAEIGYLYDMKCDNKEILATLFSLELRGVIRLSSESKIEVIRPEAYDGLAEYEKIAIRAVDESASLNEQRPTLPIDFIGPNNEIYKLELPLPYKKSISAFTKAVRNSLKTKNIPTSSFFASLSVRAFIIAVFISLLPMLSAGIPSTINGTDAGAWSLSSITFALFMTIIIDILFFPVFLTIGYLIVYLWSVIAGRYWLFNKPTRKIWPELEGYKMFIETVEIDNIQFDAKDKQTKNFITSMPYALVFGLNTKYQEMLDKRKI